MGLFVGFSALTLFEFFDVGFEMIAVAIRTRCSRKRSQAGRNSVADLGERGTRLDISHSTAWNTRKTHLPEASKPTFQDDNDGTPPPGYSMV